MGQTLHEALEEHIARTSAEGIAELDRLNVEDRINGTSLAARFLVSRIAEYGFDQDCHPSAGQESAQEIPADRAAISAKVATAFDDGKQGHPRVHVVEALRDGSFLCHRSARHIGPRIVEASSLFECGIVKDGEPLPVYSPTRQWWVVYSRITDEATGQNHARAAHTFIAPKRHVADGVYQLTNFVLNGSG